jgi:hypothetical protein
VRGAPGVKALRRSGRSGGHARPVDQAGGAFWRSGGGAFYALYSVRTCTLAYDVKINDRTELNVLLVFFNAEAILWTPLHPLFVVGGFSSRLTSNPCARVKLIPSGPL